MESVNFLLTIHIKAATLKSVSGFQQKCFVETFVGDTMVDSTDPQGAPYEFNQTITRSLKSINSEIIKFYVYKKKWIRGYKVVGSVETPLKDMHIDEGVESHVLTNGWGTLQFDLTLQSQSVESEVLNVPFINKTVSDTIYGKALGLFTAFDNKHAEQQSRSFLFVLSIVFIVLNHLALTKYSQELCEVETRFDTMKKLLESSIDL